MPAALIRLRPDNFTPATRTPWGGARLVQHYKRELVAAADPAAPVGESWELSASDELPSRTTDGRLLSAVLAEAPEPMLGREARIGRTTTALLVKWLDAADGLSLQIHPRDDYPGLGPGESGKVEAWYVVAADPDAGFYFGFAPGVGIEDVRNALAREGGDLRRCMQWVPAGPGDFALIEPGTPHAVGRGLTLVEPQRVLPGRRALTYRYWDFGRRYDAQGRPSPDGQLRPLHLEHALAVSDFARAADPDWLATRRAALGWPAPNARARFDLLCGSDQDARVRGDALRVARLCGTGELSLPDWDVLQALTVVEGVVELALHDTPERVRAGETVALPACLGGVRAQLRGAHALLSATLG